MRQPKAAAYGTFLEIAAPCRPLQLAMMAQVLKLSKMAESLPLSSPKRAGIMKRIGVLESYCILGGLADSMMETISEQVLEPKGIRLMLPRRRGRRVEFRHQVLDALERSLANPKATRRQMYGAYSVPNLTRQVFFLKALLERENIPLPRAQEYLLVVPITE